MQKMSAGICEASMQWFAVRMKPNANGAAKTAIIDVEKEAYKTRSGRPGLRKVKGTGRRVFLPEHLLKRAGFEVFLPIKQVWRIKNRFTKEKQLVAVPLLADWMFVGWPVGEDRWHRLMSFDVVAGVMGTGGRPIRMSDARVQKLMVEYGNPRVSAKVNRRIAGRRVGVGDVAQVLDGPFEGFEGQVLELSEQKASVLLNLFGRETPVEIMVDVLGRDEREGVVLTDV
jgi:transcription antitermination factor NusG